MDREYRRLGVLRVAHRRTLHAIVPDHVANSLQKIYSDTKNVDYGRTRRELNLISADNQPIPMNHSVHSVLLNNLYSSYVLFFLFIS
jgi:hypothetical protein